MFLLKSKNVAIVISYLSEIRLEDLK